VFEARFTSFLKRLTARNVPELLIKDCRARIFYSCGKQRLKGLREFFLRDIATPTVEIWFSDFFSSFCSVNDFQRQYQSNFDTLWVGNSGLACY